MITRAHVQELLDRPDDDARLVVVEGEALVVSPDALSGGRYRGALDIASRRDVAGGLDAATVVSPAALDEVAARLDAQVGQLGG